MTKSFGNFAGGGLKYWPNDDGLCNLDQLRERNAMHVDTKRSMLLFDGHRCHSVAPFSGERYSLVFFTTIDHHKAGQAEAVFMAAAGVAWPTPNALHYWTHLVSPPRGESQSIRTMFGYEERPPAIQYAGTPLCRLGDSVDHLLGYLATPLAMPTLCAVARFLCSACWRPEAWEGVLVDTCRVRPCGRNTHRLWQKWSGARAVIHGAWAASNVGVIASNKIAVWRWRPRVMLGGLSVAVSHVPIQPPLTVFIEQLSGCAAICITGTSDPASIVSTVVEGHGRSHTVLGVLLKPGVATLCNAGVVIGTATTRCTPTLMTLSVSETQLEVSAQGSFACAADHGGVALPAARYAALVCDDECHAHPRWTKLEDRHTDIM